MRTARHHVAIAASCTLLRIKSHLQRFANMVLGGEPVEFPEYYRSSICAGAWEHLFAADVKYMWAHQNGFNQWWVDELTIDPSKLVMDEEGYPLKDELKDVVLESDMINASIGSVPSTQVILCMHAVHGTLAFIPALGMKRGRKDAQEGVTLWLDNLTEADQEKLKQRKWYCDLKAVDKMRKKGTPGQQVDFDQGYTLRNFLVCTLSACMCAITCKQ